MGKVIIQDYTTKSPITMIGAEAGYCWGADTSDQKKNYKRGIECLENDHSGTIEFLDVYMVLDGYFMPKCKLYGFCKEKYICGLMPRREVTA